MNFKTSFNVARFSSLNWEESFVRVWAGKESTTFEVLFAPAFSRYLATSTSPILETSEKSTALWETSRSTKYFSICSYISSGKSSPSGSYPNSTSISSNEGISTLIS